MKRIMMTLAVFCLVGSAFAAVTSSYPPENDYLEAMVEADYSEVDDGKYEVSGYVEADSGSAVSSVTVAGLPSGVKYYKDENWFSGIAKAGDYVISVTAKNANGFTHTAYCRLIVGDYDTKETDEIGCFGFLDDELRTGSGNVYCEIPSGISVSGLPTGLTLKKKAFFDGETYYDVISGVPTKSGAFNFKATQKVTYYDWDYDRDREVKVTETLTTARKVIVEDAGSRYVNAIAEGDGTVSGSKVYAAGATAKLTAKPSKGNVFVGWYVNDDPYSWTDADWRSATLSVTVGEDLPDEIVARFVSSEEDQEYGLRIYCDEEWRPEFEGGEAPEFWFSIDTLSTPKVTVKGLPSGIKLVGSDHFVADLAKKPNPGYYDVTITAQNQSKASDTAKVTVIVPNWTSDYFSIEDVYGPYEPGEKIDVIDLSDLLRYGSPENETLAVKGLPKGLTFNTKPVQNCCEPDYPANSISGTPTAPGKYTVTFTAKVIVDETEDARGNVKYVYATETATATFIINDYPPVSVTMDEEAERAGNKVSGAGNYMVGSKVTLKATAAKDWVFLYWEGDSIDESSARNPTVTFSSRGAAEVRAVFLPVSEDFLFVAEPDIDEFGCHFTFPVGEPLETSGDVMFLANLVESATAPTITVSGLPKGLTFNAKPVTKSCCDEPFPAYSVTGTPTTPGFYDVTMTVKNLSGRTFTQLLTVRIDGEETVYSCAAGVPVDDEGICLMPWTYQDYDSVTYSVSGLPAGLKYDKKTLAVTGTPTKSGKFSVAVTATYKIGRQSTKETTSFLFVVEPEDSVPEEYINWPEGDEPAWEGQFLWNDLRVGDQVENVYIAWEEDKEGVTDVKGLPTGLKLVKEVWKEDGYSGTEFVVSGTLTKVGRYDIVFTAKVDGKTLKTTKSVVVKDSPCVYYDLQVDKWAGGSGTVSGGGILKPGAKLSLKATAAKGSVFAGWWTEDDEPADCQAVDFRSPTVTGTVPSRTDDLVVWYARFIETSKDYVYVEEPSPDEIVSGWEWSLDILCESGSLPTVKVTGLPDGVTCALTHDAIRLEYEPWMAKKQPKPGDYKVTVTATNASKLSDSCTFTLTVAPYPELTLEVDGDPANKVAGGGSYPADTQVTLKATPAKGHVFAGWYCDDEPLYMGEDDYRNPTCRFWSPDYDMTVVGRFVTVEEDVDYGISVWCDDIPDPVNPGEYAWIYVGVDSLSLPTVTVSGLPKGMKYYPGWGEISGNPTDPGLYTVTINAKNASGCEAEPYVFDLMVNNYHSDYLPLDEVYDLVPGQAVSAEDLGIGDDLTGTLEGWTVTGLPKGMTFRNGVFSGAPSEQCTNYTVWFTRKIEGKTETATAVFAVGSYPRVDVFVEATDENGETVENTSAFKVTGANGYPAGSRVTLTATAPANYVFAGWEGLPDSFEGDERASSVTFVNDENDYAVYARFIHQSQDRLWVDTVGEIDLEVGQPLEGEWLFGCDSMSEIASLAVTGLPSGLTYDTTTGLVSGAPRVAGVSYVTVVAKNAGGYAHSAMFRIRVGGAEEPEALNELGLDLSFFDGFATGHCYDYDSLEFAIDAPASTVSVSGLPERLEYEVMGDDWQAYVWIGAGVAKPGKYTVTVSAKPTWSNKILKTVKTFVVQDSGSAYLMVSSPEPKRGTVSGSGVYALGSRAKISAKPAAGYLFAGWYRDADFYEPFYELETIGDLDYRTAEPTVDFLDSTPRIVYAKFIPISEDWLYFDDPNEELWNVNAEYGFDVHVPSMLQSGSLPTVDYAGLPKGFKWSHSEMALVFDASLGTPDPGLYTVTISARNVSGLEDQKTLKIRLPNYRSEALSWMEDQYCFEPGVTVEDWSSDDLIGWDVTGLPTGLRFNKLTGEFSGAPAVPGDYTVWFRKNGQTATAVFTVNPFPELAIEVNVDDPDGTAPSRSAFKVTGAGNYPAGTKVTLGATAPSGWVFAGWDGIECEDEEYPVDVRLAAYPFVTRTDGESSTLIANFMPVKYDCLRIYDGIEVDEWSGEVDGQECFEFWVGETADCWMGDIVESGSYPTLTVTGLPSGMSFDPKTLMILGTPTKAGWYSVSVSGVNAGGYKHAATLRFCVYDANGGEPPRDDERGNLDDYIETWGFGVWSVGQENYAEIMYDQSVVKGLTVTLPTGLKKEFDSWDGESYCEIGGTLKVVGRYVIKITGKVDGQTLSTTRVIYVRAEPSFYVSLQAVTLEGGNGGSVSAGGIFDGSAMSFSVSATANPGYVFAGWYRDPWCEEPIGGNGAYGEILEGPDYRQAKANFGRCSLSPSIYARFEPKGNDDYVGIQMMSTYGEWSELWGGEEREIFPYELIQLKVESLSYPTVTVTGLPTGYDVGHCTDGTIFFWWHSSSEPRVGAASTVKITAKNQSGISVTRTLKLTIVDD